MSRPYTEDELSEQLSADRTWRLKEISDLKVAAERADERLRQVLMRSLVTICYAHWEGFVRFASKKYLDHIALRKLQYDSLDRQFIKNFFSPRIASFARSNASFVDRCNLIEDILSSGSKRFAFVNDDLVNTRANLSSDVLFDICLVCGIDTAMFTEKKLFIDVTLLKRRNAIAHGEDTLIGIEDLDEISAETVAMMRSFGDALENQAYLRAYRAA